MDSSAAAHMVTHDLVIYDKPVTATTLIGRAGVDNVRTKSQGKSEVRISVRSGAVKWNCVLHMPNATPN